MKLLKTITIPVFCIGLLFATSSCVMVKKDNGLHKGWFKNRNNPHHPNSTNPGKAKHKKKKMFAKSVITDNFYQWQQMKHS